MAIDIDFILAKLTLDASNAETKMRSMMAWCQQGPSRLGDGPAGCGCRFSQNLGSAPKNNPSRSDLSAVMG